MDFGFGGVPISQETTTRGGTSHGFASVVTGYRNCRAGTPDAAFLPEEILGAIALVYESAQLRVLHITIRQVLATLVRFALNKKDPTSLAFVKKSTIAQHLGISEATVYRALSSLERMGLIERERQQRTRTKLKVIARIAFTGKLLQYIGTPSQPSRKTNRQDLALSLAPMRDMNHPKQSSTKKHRSR